MRTLARSLFLGLALALAATAAAQAAAGAAGAAALPVEVPCTGDFQFTGGYGYGGAYGSYSGGVTYGGGPGTYGSSGGWVTFSYGNGWGYGGYVTGCARPPPPASPPPLFPPPSPSPSLSPGPSPSPSPSLDGSLGPTVTCSGKAYDGYLSACAVSMGGLSTTITDGSFSFTGVQTGQLEVLRVTPAPRTAAAQASAAATAAGDVCRDIATLLPHDMPLLAPRPASCASPIVISTLTTLLALAPEDITEAELKAVLRLPSSWSILTDDSLRGAVRGSGNAKQVLTAELQLKQAVSIGAALLALPGNSTSYQALSHTLLRGFASLARRVARGVPAGAAAAPAGAAASRRLAQAGSLPAVNLASAELLLQLLQEVQAAVNPGEVAAITAEVLQAVANVIAVWNEIVQGAPSVEYMQRAMAVSQTTIAAQVEGLVNGTLTIEQFEAATTPDMVRQDIEGWRLRGVLLPGEGSGSQRRVAVGVGVGLGVGLPTLAATLWLALHVARTRTRRAAAARLNLVGGAEPRLPPPSKSLASSLSLKAKASLNASSDAFGTMSAVWVDDVNMDVIPAKTLDPLQGQ